MRVALLSPGPSLAKLKKVPPADVVIAVNRAALVYECDWFAALDAPFIRESRAKLVGKPHLFTRLEYLHKFPDWHARSVESLAQYCPRIAELALYTIPAAMIFAGWLGADAIGCYGVDMAGSGGFDPKVSTSHDAAASQARTEDRWQRERKLFEAAVQFLTVREIKVTRFSAWT